MNKITQFIENEKYVFYELKDPYGEDDRLVIDLSTNTYELRQICDNIDTVNEYMYKGNINIYGNNNIDFLQETTQKDVYGATKTWEGGIHEDKMIFCRTYALMYDQINKSTTITFNDNVGRQKVYKTLSFLSSSEGE